jgi:hypothetical protein
MTLQSTGTDEGARYLCSGGGLVSKEGALDQSTTFRGE